MQALILAGGLGTRLRDAVKDSPKAMAPVNGRPFLEYQIEILKSNGINDIVLSTGYMSEKIEEYFGSGKNHGISITYVKEKDLLGTGGAIKKAKDFLEEHFFALNGDSVFLVDLGVMLKFHKNNQADLTIALAKVNDRSRFGNVEIDAKSQIVGFFEKDNSQGSLINGGVYIFERDNFDWQEFPEKFSIETDFFPRVISGNTVFGFVSDAFFIDIGTVDDYRKLGEQISAGKIQI